MATIFEKIRARKDGNHLLGDVPCRYRAPMGRRTITQDTEASVLLFKVRMVDGDYDVGGAYWGGPGVAGNHLFAAIGDDFRVFLRAKNMRDASEQLKESTRT